MVKIGIVGLGPIGSMHADNLSAGKYWLYHRYGEQISFFHSTYLKR